MNLSEQLVGALLKENTFEPVYAKLILAREQGDTRSAKLYLKYLDKVAGSGWEKEALKFGDPGNPRTRAEVLAKAHHVLSSTSMGVLMDIDDKAGIFK